MRSALRGLAEPVLVLALALAVTVALTQPFVPTRMQLEFPLRPDPGETAVPHEQLVEQVEGLDLIERAQVMLVDGASRLILEGVDDPDRAASAVGDLLDQSGYRFDEPVRREVVHMEGLLRTEPRTLPLVMSIQAIIFSLAGLFFGRRIRVEASAVRPRTSRTRAVLFGVASGVAAVVLSAALVALLKLVGLPVAEQDWLSELYPDLPALLRVAPWVVVISPVSEELFFRFYVFRFIAAHVGFPAGLVVSSLMFAVIHLNPSGLLIYLGIGCVLAAVYRYTGRLIAPIVGHATLNAIVLVISAAAVRLGVS